MSDWHMQPVLQPWRSSIHICPYVNRSRSLSLQTFARNHSRLHSLVKKERLKVIVHSDVDSSSIRKLFVRHPSLMGRAVIRLSEKNKIKAVFKLQFHVSQLLLNLLSAIDQVNCKETGEFGLEFKDPVRYVPWCSASTYPLAKDKKKEMCKFPLYFNGPKPFEVS